VSTLLSLLDGINEEGQIIVIGTTNRIDTVDPALRRPGRFDKEVYFPAPDMIGINCLMKLNSCFAGRADILGKQFEHMEMNMNVTFNTPSKTLLVKEVAGRTEGYTGADLKLLCEESISSAVKRVHPQIFHSHKRLDLSSAMVDCTKIEISPSDMFFPLSFLTPSTYRGQKSVQNQFKDHISSHPTFGILLLEQVRLLEGTFCSSYLKSEHFGNGLEDSPFDCCNSLFHSPKFQSSLLMSQMNLETLSSYQQSNSSSSSSSSFIDHSPSPSHLVIGEPFTPSRSTNASNVAKLLTNSLLYKLSSSLPHIPISTLTTSPSLISKLNHSDSEEENDAPKLSSSTATRYIYKSFSAACPKIKSHSPRSSSSFSKGILFIPDYHTFWERTTLEEMEMFLWCLGRFSDEVMCVISYVSEEDEEDEELIEDGGGTVISSPVRRDHEKVSKDDVRCRSISNKVTDILWGKEDENVFQVDLLPSPTITAQIIESLKGDLLNLPSQLEEIRGVISEEGVRWKEPLPFASDEREGKKQFEEEGGSKPISEKDLHYQRELRILLRTVMRELVKDKRNHPLLRPVDPEVIEDYYLVIKNPIDFETIKMKIDDGYYLTQEEFLADLRLITSNAKAYNPQSLGDEKGRSICHISAQVEDVAKSLLYKMEKKLKYKLFSKCKKIMKRLMARKRRAKEGGWLNLEERRLLEVREEDGSFVLGGVRHYQAFLPIPPPSQQEGEEEQANGHMGEEEDDEEKGVEDMSEGVNGTSSSLDHIGRREQLDRREEICQIKSQSLTQALSSLPQLPPPSEGIIREIESRMEAIGTEFEGKTFYEIDEWIHLLKISIQKNTKNGWPFILSELTN